MNPKKDQKNKIIMAVAAVIVALVVIFGIVKLTGKNNNKSQSSNSTNKVVKKSTSNSNKSSNSKVKSSITKGKFLKKEPTKSQFNKIKVADTSEKNSKGSTLSEAEKLLGKPTNLTTNTIKGTTSSYANWTYIRKQTSDSISLSISFTNQRAVSKAIVGFKVDRPKKISLSDFNNIKNGTTYDEVIKEFGEPNGLTESISSKKTFKTAIFSSNLNTNPSDSKTANVTFVFTANKLTAKNQTGLK
ncbi:DUF3862 domain-containing protein [Xylocopilactobacillus apis]|uniref:DUF3862 domain-containing protein n=1 Tax=Xylocopilactobacillus apis TaxID=2932183 RepID=A0AAU9CRB9_9LACO|nr:DUF3862 domain-containing protein [Xylocopilactobacillus apis]BDR56467.1 hypothetical protein KIMC2_10290 [Xylocopilactobacillus apis]